MSHVAISLRSGSWVTPQRIRVYCAMLLVVTLAMLGYLALTANGVNDYMGRPLGTDFSNVYSAGKLVLDGKPTAPFNTELHYREQQRIFGEATPFYGWCYPPFFLWVAALLASLPYVMALISYQLATFAFYLKNLGSIAPFRDVILVGAAFSAVSVNFTHGHNGFMTAALMGYGLLLLPTRQVLAGICLGLLVYKPQFGVLIPLALAAGGYWRAFLSASATVITLVALATLFWGVEIWHAFAGSFEFTRVLVLEQGDTGFYKIQSIFSWVRMWGGNVPMAYVLQGAVALGVAVTLWRFWRSDAAYEHKASALIIGSLLVTPYLLDYDLVAMAPALAFSAAYGLRHGFRDWEKTLLALAYLMPFFTRQTALYASIPLGAIVMLVLYWQMVASQKR